MSNVFSYAIGVVSGGLAVLAMTGIVLMSNRHTRTAILKDIGWIDN